MGRMNSSLKLCKVLEGGKRFETGTPVSFNYLHNTEKSPQMGPRFGQDVEPAGLYMAHDTHPKGPSLPNWERGETAFKNPLVLELVIDKSTGIYGPTGWKARLHKIFGKKGKALSCHLRRLGYDAIVTCDHHGESHYTSEIVDLRSVRCGRS